LLLKAGVPEEAYNYLEAHAEREIEAGLIPQYTCLQCIVATRANVLLPDLANEEGEEEAEENMEDE